MSESDSPQTIEMPHMMTVAREWLRDENARMASSGETVRVGCTAHIVAWLLAEVQRLRLHVCDRISELSEAEHLPTLTEEEREAIEYLMPGGTEGPADRERAMLDIARKLLERTN